MRFILALLTVLSVAACSAPGMNAGEPRQQAEQGATASLVGTVPDFALEAVANCVSDNAANGEMKIFIEAYQSAPSLASRQTAQAILARTQTQTCIADNGVTLSS